MTAKVGVRFTVACFVVAACAGLSAQTADDIWQRMKDTYASAKAYSDTGEIVDYPDATSSNSILRNWAHHTFTTYFSRSPRGFFLDYHKNEGNRFVVWGDPDAFHTWDKYTHVRSDHPNPNNLGAMTGSPAITKVPTLLYAKAPLLSDFGYFENMHLGSTEAVDGHRCFRLEGETHDQYGATGKVVNARKLTLWIDTDSFLIRKTSQDFGPRPGDGQHTVEMITYRPVLNPAIDESKFKFSSPDNK